MLQVMWWRQTVLKSIWLILIAVRCQQGVRCDVKSRRRRDEGKVLFGFWVIGGSLLRAERETWEVYRRYSQNATRDREG